MQFDNKNIKSIGHNIANSATSHNRTAFIVADGIFMENEIWKDINGYEGVYQISNIGNVKSLSRQRWNGNNFYLSDNIILKPSISTHGYPYVVLYKNSKPYHKHIHRLVASAFIPNPENKPCINHIDGIKINPNVKNLEWCTYSENELHAYSTGLQKGSMIGRFGKNHHISKAVIQIDDNGNVINVFESMKEASIKTNTLHSKISLCANGKRKHAGGFIWKYVN